MPSPILKYFTFAHLPPNLQEVSKPIGELAQAMDEKLPDGAEKSAGLRKLLEAKDCLVRALLPLIIFALAIGAASTASAAPTSCVRGPDGVVRCGQQSGGATFKKLPWPTSRVALIKKLFGR